MKKVNVEKKILGENEKYAVENSFFLAENKKMCLNMISSPGSGKTTILAKTITDLKNKINIGVIEGDIETDIDAERIRATEAPVIQINTQGACHLSAIQINHALKKLPVQQLDLIFIENVGNLVCPSAFALGEDGKVVVLSVAEGHDKPAKYPAIFARSKALLINKIDLLSHVDFDIDKAIADARRLNKDIEIFPMSAKTGEGLSDWYDWLVENVERIKQK